MSFHEDALCLTDDISCGEPSVQGRLASVYLLAPIVHGHTDGNIGGQNGRELVILLREGVCGRAVKAEHAEWGPARGLVSKQAETQGAGDVMPGRRRGQRRRCERIRGRGQLAHVYRLLATKRLRRRPEPRVELNTIEFCGDRVGRDGVEGVSVPEQRDARVVASGDSPHGELQHLRQRLGTVERSDQLFGHLGEAGE